MPPRTNNIYMPHICFTFSYFLYCKCTMTIATLKRKNAALKARSGSTVAWKTSSSSHRTARIGRCCPAIVQDPSQPSNGCDSSKGAEHTSYDTLQNKYVAAHIECGNDSGGGGGGGDGGVCVLNHVKVGGRQVPYHNIVKHLDRTKGRAHAATSYDDYMRALKSKSC
jgi:hypothetical protein